MNTIQALCSNIHDIKTQFKESLCDVLPLDGCFKSDIAFGVLGFRAFLDDDDASRADAKSGVDVMAGVASDAAAAIADPGWGWSSDSPGIGKGQMLNIVLCAKLNCAPGRKKLTC